MKENPENKNSGFCHFQNEIQRSSTFSHNKTHTIKAFHSLPDNMRFAFKDFLLSLFLFYLTCLASSSCAFLLDSAFSFIHFS